MHRTPSPPPSGAASRLPAPPAAPSTPATPRSHPHRSRHGDSVSDSTSRWSPSRSTRPRHHSRRAPSTRTTSRSARRDFKQLGLLANEDPTSIPADGSRPHRPLGLALGYVERRLPSFVTPPPIDRADALRALQLPQHHRAAVRRTRVARRHHRGDAHRSGRTAAAAVHDGRPDLRRRSLVLAPVHAVGARSEVVGDERADARRCPTARRPALRSTDGSMSTLDELSAEQSPQGRRGARRLYDGRRRQPPAELRRVRGDVSRGVEPAGVERVRHGGSGLRSAAGRPAAAPAVLRRAGEEEAVQRRHPAAGRSGKGLEQRIRERLWPRPSCTASACRTSLARSPTSRRT